LVNKSGFDKEHRENYCPVYNLASISKPAEKVAALGIKRDLEHNVLLDRNRFLENGRS